MALSDAARLVDKASAALLEVAAAARANAYAPYSRYAVGAAVRTSDGRTFVGVNVEAASYGLTVCAERNAVAAAAAAGVRPGELVAVAVAAPDGPGEVSPCGACRQVLCEWAAPRATLHTRAVPGGREASHQLAALLPHAFVLAPAESRAAEHAGR